MADERRHETIIIKRYEEDEHEHHSSAWKVAHADFMTAMMAFFLIMWLISATDQNVRKAIATYFNPIHLSEDPIERKGLNDPEEIKDLGTSDDGKEMSALKNTTGPAAGPGDDIQQGDRERALFQDPYAVLAKMAGDVAPTTTTSPDAAIGETGSPGTGTGDATRDPFDPVYWQMTASRRMRTEQPGLAGNTNTPADGFPDAGARRTDAGAPPSKGQPPAGGSAPNSPTTSQAQQNGGTAGDALPHNGETAVAAVAMQAATTQAATIDKPTDVKALQKEADALREEVAADLQSTIPSDSTPQLEVRATQEGLVISLTDDIDFSMFAIGSAVPDPHLVRAMAKIGETLAKRPGNIVVRGFTDARPYRSPAYDNWRLSTARAHVAHYMLIRGGVEEKRISEIQGFADRNPKNPADPNAPENRRIEILLQEQR